MHRASPPPPPAPALRASDFVVSGLETRHLRRLVEKGELTRIGPGVCVRNDIWSELSTTQQYVVTVYERVRRLDGAVCVSHWSAAAVWGLPVPDDWPEDVQVIDPSRRTSNRIATLHRRPGDLQAGDLVAWQGIAVTCPARTASDLALLGAFETAVLVFDQGLRLRLFTRDEVTDQLGRRPDAKRRRSARAALDFASEEAEYPGESFSRVGMAMRGIAEPVLQQPFFDEYGKIGHVDFWWAEGGIVGEFDGQWKYTDERWLKGRTPADAFRDEKRRQARLEAHPLVRRVVRWDYPVARNADELARRLRAAGVPDSRPGESGRAP